MTDPFREAGEYGPAVKFDQPGSTWSAVIKACREIDDPNNAGKKVIIIEGENAANGQTETLWCGKAGLLKAIGSAMNEAGYVAGLPQPGAKIQVERIEDGVASQAGWSNPHRFTAKYQQPSTGFQAAATEAPAEAPAEAAAPATEAPAGFFS